MNSELKKNFCLSVLLHVVVFAGIVCFTAFAPTPKIDEPIVMVTIGGGGGGGEPEAAQPPPPPPPPASKVEIPPEPKTEKQPDKIEPAKIEPPKQPDIVIPKDKPKKQVETKPKVEKKTEAKKIEPPKKETKPAEPVDKPKLVTRKQFEKDTGQSKQSMKPDPRYTSAEIAKRLASAMNSVKVGPVGSGPGPATGRGVGASSEFADYYHMLSNALYDAWDIPGQTTPSMSTVVMVHVTRDGSLSFVKIVKPSGNPVMDESAMAAVNKVRKVDPLPEGMGSSVDLTITFKPVGV